MNVKRFGWMILVFFLSVSSSWAAEVTVKILAPWQGRGEVYKVSPSRIKVVGVFNGIMYIDRGTKELDAALFMCPGTQYIDLNTKKADLYADCIVSKGEDKVAYGTLRASGPVGALKGKFTIHGGEGDWAQISGEGRVFIRTAVGETDLNKKTGEVFRSAAGLAIWDPLKIKLPDKD